MAILVLGSLSIGVCVLPLLLSCTSSDGSNELLRRASVCLEAGVEDVIQMPGYSNRYLVRKLDGSVWQYQTRYTTHHEVCERILVFEALPGKPLVVPEAKALPAEASQ